MNSPRIHALALMGATAVGKTDCAVELVRRWPFEIISVDSAMIYRGMDIGSAKPSAEILTVAPHRMIDILDPARAYSAYEFARDAYAHMEQIHAAGRIPLLVGGARLYFLSLLRGLSYIPEIRTEVREQLRQELRESGPQALHERLRHCDPQTAKRLAPNDRQRILRALGVFESSGRSLSAWIQAHPSRAPGSAQYYQLALWPENRAHLHERIAQRFDQMLQDGLVDEVRRLRARGDLTMEHTSMRCVGYRQVWKHLDGEYDHAQMREAAVAATRQLAKRQLSWLRHAPDVLHCPTDGMQTETVVAAVAQWWPR